MTDTLEDLSLWLEHELIIPCEVSHSSAVYDECGVESNWAVWSSCELHGTSQRFWCNEHHRKHVKLGYIVCRPCLINGDEVKKTLKYLERV